MSVRARAERWSGAILLLVSDLDRWVDPITEALTDEGFRVVLDRAGELAFDVERVAQIDLAVVDLRLRSQSGLAVCGALRARSGVPILAIVPEGDEQATLAAFAAGVDRLATDAASPRQVVARLRALMRRLPPSQLSRTPVSAAVSVTIDDSSRVAIVDGVPVRLSRQELDVLRLLVSRPGRVVPRKELVGSWPALEGDRRLDFVIRRLRQKLEAVGGRRRISVVRGVGFRFDLDDETAN